MERAQLMSHYMGINIAVPQIVDPAAVAEC